MTTEQWIDAIVVPRPNGSAALERISELAAGALARAGATVERQPFEATPHGFELAFSGVFVLVALHAVALWRGRSSLALALLLAAAALLFAEFELLLSPLSGLASAVLHNVIGTFAGRPGGPVLVFVAHLDTTTHFADHAWWGPTGFLLGPATALGAALSIAGAVRARHGRRLAAPLRALGLLVVAPFAAMAWFHAAGPWLRAPSPGALDDGGSVVALLQLAERLAARPPDAGATVRIAFVSAEEERALGSRALASALPRDAAVAVVNLESIGAEGPLGYVPADGFAVRRFATPAALVTWVEAAAREALGAELPPLPLPVGTLTDGRSFLAAGIPALTLRATPEGSAFPRHLHSEEDSRDRLSRAALDRAAALLDAIVRRADADPDALRRAVGR